MNRGSEIGKAGQGRRKRDMSSRMAFGAQRILCGAPCLRGKVLLLLLQSRCLAHMLISLRIRPCSLERLNEILTVGLSEDTSALVLSATRALEV